MGKDKTTSTTNQTQERQLSPEEKRLMQLEIQARETVQPQQLALQQEALGLGTNLLQQQDLNKLFAGISPDVTNSIVQQSLQDIAPQFQASGILDSGVAAEISARTAGDIRRASEEFNIGNRLNLLNLALSGQAQVQSPVLSSQAMLNSQLASASPIRTSGSTTQVSMNPFLRSFQTSLGQGLGKGVAGGIGGVMGGGFGYGYESALTG